MAAGRLNIFSPKFTCLVLLALWAYAFWPSIISACHAYLHSGYDYQGLIVLPILMLLIHRNSANLKRSTFAHNSLGIILLVLLSIGWLLAFLMELEVFRQVCIISMLIAIVLTTCGKKVTSILLLPLVCLFLLLPIGQEVHNALQHGFSWLLMQALTAAKQAVYWENNIIFVNNHAYDIHAYLCSMRYILLLAACGACFAMFRSRTFSNIITIATSCVIMPLCVLWLGMFSYIMLNNLFSNLSFLEQHLAVISWGFACIGLLHAIALGIFLGDKKGFIAKNDNIDWRHEFYARGPRVFFPAILASTIILSLPLVGQEIKRQADETPTMLLNLPETIASWKRPATKTSQTIQSGQFRKGKDKEVVNVTVTAQNLELDNNWAKIKETNKTINFEQHKLPIIETVVQNNKNKYQIHWSFNYVNGHYTTNKTIAKALTQLYNLSANSVSAGTINISTEANAELNIARERLKCFLQDFTANPPHLG